MSQDVTKTQAAASEAQPKPLHISAEQIEAVRNFLFVTYGYFVDPIIALDGTVILINADGEEVGEISPDGVVCMNGKSDFSVEDAEAAISEEPSDKAYDEYLDSVGDKVPQIEIDESKQTSNSAKKYSDSNSYTQPLVSDSIETESVDVVKVEPVEIEGDDAAVDPSAGADDASHGVETAQAEQQQEQAQSTSPEGVISNTGLAPKPDGAEFELPSVEFVPSVADVIGSEQVESKKAISKASGKDASVEPGIDVATTLVEGGARAVRFDEEDFEDAQSDRIQFSLADPIAEPEAPVEAQPEFDDVEFRNRADSDPLAKNNPFAKDEGSADHEVFASISSKKPSKSKNPLCAGGMAMCDQAATIATAKEHARFGAPPYYFAANFAQESSATLKAVHHDVVLPTHGRDGHNDRQDRNGEDEGQGGYLMEDDESEEQNSVTSIA